jgi:hypothetical protein
MVKSTILTKKAMEVIEKKLLNKRLTQQDSNYLSRFVRPKLREMASIDAKSLLTKLDYSPKAIAIERKIKTIIRNILPQTQLIIICGSAVQTNYREYNDIDVIIGAEKVIDSKIKKNLIGKIEEYAKKENLNLDLQLYSKKSILEQYSHNPSLIYQLKDSKVIYGELEIPNKISLTALDLKLKLDWSEGLDISSKPNEIYYAIRNAILVLLLRNKIIDNYQLNYNLKVILGNELVYKLKNNNSNKTEKKLALNYLNALTKYLEEDIASKKWEKIVIENP